MAEDSGNEERTEEATVQRREDFRKRGQVAQSREVNSVLLLLGATLVIWGLGRFFLDQLIEGMTLTFTDHLVTAVRSGETTGALLLAGKKLLFILGPLFAIILTLSFASSVVQIGFIYNEEALNFDFEKINPVSGFGRIFSLNALVEGIKALIKVCLVVAIVYSIVKSEMVRSPELVSYDMNQLFVTRAALF